MVEGEPRIDSRLVATSLGIEHKHFLETVRTYQREFEGLGVLPFETAKPPKGSRGGRPESYVALNEDQAIFASTLSRNTRQVVMFKLKLTKAFSDARAQLQKITAGSMINSLWEKRALLFNERTRIPEGYWCIFNEIAHVCWGMELRGEHLQEDAVPDISAGLLWCKYARSLGLDMSLVRQYLHHYPDKRGTQHANIYPNVWLGTFRDWLQRYYLKREFQHYLQTHRQHPSGTIPQIQEKIR
jgi:hypothetical protein